MRPVLATKLLQREEEFAWFLEVLRENGVRSYLEIGSKYGGSLNLVARSLPRGSRVVSVDLPGEGKGSKQVLQKVVEYLSADGWDAHLILGNSCEPEIIERARELGPYDAVFIDGDHSLAGVTADWENYGPMGRVVAFHDVGYIPKEGKRFPIEVPELWERLKRSGYRYDECKLDEGSNGIGVLWLR